MSSVQKARGHSSSFKNFAGSLDRRPKSVVLKRLTAPLGSGDIRTGLELERHLCWIRTCVETRGRGFANCSATPRAVREGVVAKWTLLPQLLLSEHEEQDGVALDLRA